MSELKKLQFEVSKQMAEMMIKGKHMIHVDESTFHMWQIPGKSWVRSDTMLLMPSNRGRSVTIIGAKFIGRISPLQGISWQ